MLFLQRERLLAHLFSADIARPGGKDYARLQDPVRIATHHEAAMSIPLDELLEQVHRPLVLENVHCLHQFLYAHNEQLLILAHQTYSESSARRVHVFISK